MCCCTVAECCCGCMPLRKGLLIYAAVDGILELTIGIILAVTTGNKTFKSIRLLEKLMNFTNLLFHKRYIHNWRRILLHGRDGYLFGNRSVRQKPMLTLDMADIRHVTYHRRILGSHSFDDLCKCFFSCYIFTLLYPICKYLIYHWYKL